MAAPAAPTPALQAQSQRNFLSSFTRLSKGLSLLLVGGYLLSLVFPPTITFFALLPGRFSWPAIHPTNQDRTIPFAWNLLTCGFLELNIIYLLIDVAGLLFLGRLLEPVWGTKEFIRFVVVTSSSTAACTFVLIFLVYCFTLQGRLLYTPICGFHGVLAGFLVAVKQTMPEQELPLPLKLRAKWLPSLLVLAVCVRAALGIGVLYVPFIVFGTYNAWIYLRFFQSRGDQGGTQLKGDPSDDFAFATFFPEPMRPVVSTVAAVVGRIFCGRRPQGDGSEVPAAGMPLPGSHPIEASRRRERGARALEERLSKAAEGVALGTAEKQPAKPSGGTPKKEQEAEEEV